MPKRKREVIWTELAAADLDDILGFIATQAPLNARKLLTRIRRRAESLAILPERGRTVPELAYFGIRTWRELQVKPFRLIYRVAPEAVYVLAVFDGRRDLHDVLLERLVRDPS